MLTARLSRRFGGDEEESRPIPIVNPQLNIISFLLGCFAHPRYPRFTNYQTDFLSHIDDLLHQQQSNTVE